MHERGNKRSEGSSRQVCSRVLEHPPHPVDAKSRGSPAPICLWMCNTTCFGPLGLWSNPSGALTPGKVIGLCENIQVALRSYIGISQTPKPTNGKTRPTHKTNPQANH